MSETVIYQDIVTTSPNIDIQPIEVDLWGLLPFDLELKSRIEQRAGKRDLTPIQWLEDLANQRIYHNDILR